MATLKKAAASPGSVPPASLLAAVVQLEKARLPPAGWNKTLAAPRRRWHLVYTVPGKDVTAASKGKKSGSGMYFPLTGCQKFEDGQFENGVFLGPAASLTFRGPCAMKEGGRQMSFDVTTMHIGLGPWRWALPLKRDAPALEARPPKDVKKLPFFLYAYVDNDIVVARGRSGGLAMWRSVGAEWQATAGVLQVYK